MAEAVADADRHARTMARLELSLNLARGHGRREK
jgi:hypothetical protein